jgi:hypothetical protein
MNEPVDSGQLVGGSEEEKTRAWRTGTSLSN